MIIEVSVGRHNSVYLVDMTVRKRIVPVYLNIM